MEVKPPSGGFFIEVGMKTITFDAEKWLYERKSAYPMVECVSGSAEGLWQSFNYHSEYNGKVLQDGDKIKLD